MENLPLHVFISYSRDDYEFVSTIKNTLEQYDIPVWVDTQNLVPGTPNWEKTIRNALQDSYVLLLVKSPSSRDSIYVQAELSLAQNYKIPILPIWFKGHSWVDSAPLSISQTQYINLHESNPNIEFSSLIQNLKNIIIKRKPKHFLVTDPFAGWYDKSSFIYQPKLSSWSCTRRVEKHLINEFANDLIMNLNRLGKA